MPFPDWVKEESDYELYGKAAGFGAPADTVLLSKTSTTAFIKAKESAGKFMIAGATCHVVVLFLFVVSLTFLSFLSIAMTCFFFSMVLLRIPNCCCTA